MGWRNRIIMQHFLHDFKCGAGKWALTGEQLVDDDADGEQIGAGVERLAAHLFRRHVVGGADAFGALLTVDDGKPKVTQLELTVAADEQVGRLDVGVDDCLPMHVGQRIEQLVDPGQVDGAATVQARAQRQTVNIVERQPVAPVGLAGRDRAHDMRMAQALADLPFVPGPAAAELDSDDAAVAQVARAMDHAACASTQHRFQYIIAHLDRIAHGKTHKITWFYNTSS